MLRKDLEKDAHHDVLVPSTLQLRQAKTGSTPAATVAKGRGFILHTDNLLVRDLAMGQELFRLAEGASRLGCVLEIFEEMYLAGGGGNVPPPPPGWDRVQMEDH